MQPQVATTGADIGLHQQALAAGLCAQQQVARHRQGPTDADIAQRGHQHQRAAGIAVAGRRCGQHIDGVAATAMGALDHQVVALGDEDAAAALVGQGQAGHLGAQVLAAAANAGGGLEHQPTAHDEVFFPALQQAALERAAETIGDGAGAGLNQRAAVGLKAAELHIASSHQIDRAQTTGTHGQQRLAIGLQNVAAGADVNKTVGAHNGLQQDIAGHRVDLDLAVAVVELGRLHHIALGGDGQHTAAERDVRTDLHIGAGGIGAQAHCGRARALNALTALVCGEHPQMTASGAHRHLAGTHLGDLAHPEVAALGQFVEHHSAAGGVAHRYSGHVEEAQICPGGGAHAQVVGDQGLSGHTVAQYTHGIALQHQALGGIQVHVGTAGHPCFDAVLQGDVVDRVERDVTVDRQEEGTAGRHVGDRDASTVHRKRIPEQRSGAGGVRTNAHLARSGPGVVVDALVPDDNAFETIHQSKQVVRRQVEQGRVGIRRIANFVAHTERGGAQRESTVAAHRLGPTQEVGFVGLDQDVAADPLKRLHHQPTLEDHLLGASDAQAATHNAHRIRKTHDAAGLHRQVAMQDHLTVEGDIVGQVKHTRAHLYAAHRQALEGVLRVLGLARLGKTDAA